MAKQKAADWIPIYNNLARARGIGEIPITTKMTLDEIADKIEWVSKLPQINRVKGKPPTKRIVESEHILLSSVQKIFNWCTTKSLQN